MIKDSTAVPVDRVASARDDRIRLRKGIVAEELPDFEETHHVPVGDVTFLKQHHPEYDRPMIWCGPISSSTP